MKFLTFILILFIASCASTSKNSSTVETVNKSTEEGVITCVAGKDKRTIANKRGKTSGCEVVYEKQGESSVVATAQSNLAHCGEVVDRMKSNLEKHGFSCN